MDTTFQRSWETELEKANNYSLNFNEISQGRICAIPCQIQFFRSIGHEYALKLPLTRERDTFEISNFQ